MALDSSTSTILSHAQGRLNDKLKPKGDSKDAQAHPLLHQMFENGYTEQLEGVDDSNRIVDDSDRDDEDEKDEDDGDDIDVDDDEDNVDDDDDDDGDEDEDEEEDDLDDELDDEEEEEEEDS